MKLETTKDYSKFTQNHEQRPINIKHAKMIAENMQHVGFLPSKPIQCYKQGSKLVVVDGHHRLEAAKAIGIPVFYVVEPQSCQQTMAAENMLVRKWEAIDFVRLYASRGLQDYIILMNYIEKGIPCSMAASMLHGEGANSGNTRESLANGKFKIKTFDYANKISLLIEVYGKREPAIKSRAFISSVSKCLFCNEFDFDTFRSRIDANLSMIQKTSNEDQMLDIIEAIYNYRSRTQIPLKHLVKETSKIRHHKFGK